MTHYKSGSTAATFETFALAIAFGRKLPSAVARAWFLLSVRGMPNICVGREERPNYAYVRQWPERYFVSGGRVEV